MEILKQNESFILKDTTDVYELKGSVNLETSGSVHINFAVNNVDDSHVGDCYYSRYAGSDNVSFSMSCGDESRDALYEYASSVIAFVLYNFNPTI